METPESLRGDPCQASACARAGLSVSALPSALRPQPDVGMVLGIRA